MSWLSTALDVATLATSMHNRAKLNQMEKMAELASVNEAIRAVLLDYVFRANEAKENLLEHKTRKPIAVAAGLHYLELEIAESGIKSEVFRNISDKEYFASTLRSIRQQKRELLENMDAELQQRVELAARSVRQYEELAFVIRSYDDAVRLRNLLVEQRRLETNKPKAGLLGSRDLREWQASYDRVKSQIEPLGGQLSFDQWETQRRKFGDQQTGEELSRRLMDMETLIQSVFEDRAFIPQLALIAVSTDEKDAGSLPSASPQDDGRVACPICGYRNSKHRTICKNCRGSMPQ